ncbi:molybdate transport system ATP-binding protein [Nocardia sp. GAS34]
MVNTPLSNGDAGLAVSVRLAERGLDVELAVEPGEVLAVLGPNGAGKSTLLEIISGLVRPDAGYVRLDGRALTDTTAGVAIPAHRREISLLAQDPLLFPHLTAAANVAFGPRSRGIGRRAAVAVAREWLRAVDATALADRRPGELSGGQAQRIALARALAVQPRVVLLDEPMAALDVAAAPAMRILLGRALRDSAGAFSQQNTHARSAILVTHDIVDALTLADRVVVVESGRIVEQGPVTEVLSRPRSAFAARIAGVNLMIGAAVAPETESAHTPLGVEEGRRQRASLGTAAREDDVLQRDALPGVFGGGHEIAPSAGRRDDLASDTAAWQHDAVAPGSVRAEGSAAGEQPEIHSAAGAVRCGEDTVYGRCAGPWTPGVRAAAVFSPAAVAVYKQRPIGSPRNVFRVRVAELTDRGGVVRVHSADRPDGTAGMVADLTPAAVAELEIVPGEEVYFSVKAGEVQVYPC